jgi:hypothetical protein
MASIHGDIDAVVILHFAVWLLAGMWVLLWRDPTRLRTPMRFGLPQKLAMPFVFCLGLSALVSQAPLLTLFTVYQMGVMLLLGFLFVRRYGPRACLQRLFWGYTLLLIGAGIFALYVPRTAFEAMQSGGLRLRVDQITPAVGQVAAFAIILLLTIPPKLPRMLYLSLLALDVAILLLSHTRSAYLCLFVFLALALVKKTRSAAPRIIGYLLLAAIPVLLATGLLPSIVALVVRESESLGTLSGRTDLWAYLADLTLKQSPWIGLGYYSASRTYGLQYSFWAGVGHSTSVDVLVGGGLLSLGFFALLWSALLLFAASLLLRTTDRYAFAACSLLISVFLVSQVGDGINFGAFGFTFWCLAAILPQLHSQRLFDLVWFQSKHEGTVTSQRIPTARR